MLLKVDIIQYWFIFLKNFCFQSLTLKNKSKSNSIKIEIKADIFQIPKSEPGKQGILSKSFSSEYKPPQKHKL